MWFHVIFVSLLLVTMRADYVVTSKNSSCGAYHANDTLQQALMQDLMTCTRMRQNPFPMGEQKVMVVKFEVVEVKLIKHDQRSNQKTFVFTIKYSWKNLFYSWNNATYPPSHVFIPSYLLWRPKAKLLYASPSSRYHFDGKTKVSYDGTTQVIITLEFTVDCASEYARYPRDEHKCVFPLTFDHNTISPIRFLPVFKKVLTSKMKEWTISLNNFYKNTPFAVVFSKRTEVYPVYLMFLKIQRNPILHHRILTIPTFLISLFLLISLWVPAKNNQRFALTLFLLLCLFTQLRSFQQAVPNSMSDVPILMKYMFVLLFMLLFCLMTSVVTSLLRKQLANRHLSPVAKAIFFHPILQRVLFVSHHANLPPALPAEATDNKKLAKMMMMLDEWVTLKAHESGFSDKLANNDFKLVALCVERMAFVVVAVVLFASFVITSAYVF